MFKAHEVTLQIDVKRSTYREFLYYGLAAVLILFMAVAFMSLIWFMLPQVPPAMPGDLILLNSQDIPLPGFAPKHPQEKFFLVHTADGTLIALFDQAPNTCLLRWIEEYSRFQEACHSYRYEIDGTYLPGGRIQSNLPRYFISVVFTDGTSASSNEAGDPVLINGREIQSVTVDMRKLIVPE